jgi:ATP-dependent DNA helicase RecG
MFNSIQKLNKILALEIQNKFSNRAIIGGLDKFLPTILPDLNSDGIKQEQINKIVDFFQSYTGLNLETRISAIKELQYQLSLVPNTVSQITTTNRTTPAAPSGIIIDEKPIDKPIHSQPTKASPQKENIGLKAPVSSIRGIGITRTSELHTLGVNSIIDLLYYFPRRYLDYSILKPINRVEYGDELTIIATVQSLLSSRTKNPELSRVEVVVSDGTGFLRLLFFRATRYLRSFEAQFQRGKQLVISGKIDLYLGRKQMKDPNFEELDQNLLSTNGIIPVYPLVAGLTQKFLRNVINETIKFYVHKISDHLPIAIKQSAKLIDLAVALHQIHYPNTMELLESAKQRLAFDEIFLLQLGVLQQKKNWVSHSAAKYSLSAEKIESIISTFPFTLTNAQRKVLTEVQNDLSRGVPMNRLLQGDVGSGKTVIAAVAAAIVALNGAQTVLMAPTSILAEQHYQSMLKLLCKDTHTDLPLLETEICLLTGDTNQKNRENIKQGLLEGTIKLIVGTHALLEEPIQFQNLQLAVIDEQHRFGVTQRSTLRKKGSSPHLLVMTATPIPRSLALTVYGDLDLSVMDEMPIGRKPVKTYVLNPLERERAYQLIRSSIENGHQAFIVYPLIEQGDNDEIKAAVEDQKILQSEIVPDLKVGLLHGKMRPEEKESVMRSFRDKEFHILVSTTVIEVGVDIPNAAVMMIEGANRFGLAQLHQLRGRVGRSENQAICLLIPDTEDSLENERLMVMTETNDGFVLAEKDLEQRGPGDFIGYRQSGFADLRMASITDIRLIEKARGFAQELYDSDPLLAKPENELLLNKLSEFWKVETSDIS